MWPTIRSIGLIDIAVSLSHVVYVAINIYKSDGAMRNSGQEINNGDVHEKQFVFFLLEHMLLVLRLISAVIIFGSSFKEDFGKHFNACVLWAFIALISVIVLTFQLFICTLKLSKIVFSVLEIIFRVVSGFFVINYMRNEVIE